VPIDEARRRAVVSVGNITRLREQSRDLWGFPALESFAQDARYGLRQLRRTPLFASATIVTLALTIGATTALFAIANAVVFRPLPYRQSDRLVRATIEYEGSDAGRFDEGTAQLAMRVGMQTLEAVAVSESTSANLIGGAQPDRIAGATVSGRFFDVMGVHPILGRTFTPDEQQRGGPRAIVLSHALWDRAFGRATDVVDRSVRLDDVSYRIVGVMPAGFTYPGAAAYWRPWTPRGTGSALYYTDFVGRLRPGIEPSAARDELTALRRAHEAELTARTLKTSIHVLPLHEALRGGFRRPLVLLLGVVTCVLLVACANIANLLLARTSARRRELGLRTALGAGRVRLVRQLLIESVLLSLLGAMPGLAIAYGGLRVFKALGPNDLARLSGIEIDPAVAFFSLAVTLGTGLLVGVAPAIAAGRADPQGWIKASAGALDERGRSHPKRLLVVLELAAAVVLTIGAALLAKSFLNYSRIDRGFEADTVITATIPLPFPRYADARARREFSDRVLDRLRRLPSVVSATHSQSGLTEIVMTIPLPARFTKSGRISEAESYAVSFIGSDYFRTFGVPIVAGTECPSSAVERLAIISEPLARLMFPNQSPLGQTIGVSGEGRHTIVGVAGDVRALRTNTPTRPRVYVCDLPERAPGWGTLAVRVRDGIDPMSLAPALREAVQAADPAQPIVDVKTVPQMVGEAMVSRWFEGGLIASFAVIVVVLAAFGLYAVVAYLVAQRTHEIGVRMALGARSADVLGLVLRQGGALAAIGIATGVLAAVPLVRFVRSMLFDVQPLDASVFVSVAAFLAIVALTATCIPAIRASRVDPVVALRTE
jgi:predicted permease